MPSSLSIIDLSFAQRLVKKFFFVADLFKSQTKHRDLLVNNYTSMNYHHEFIKLKGWVFVHGKNRQIFYYPPTNNFFYFTGNGYHVRLSGNWWGNNKEVLLIKEVAAFKEENFYRKSQIDMKRIIHLKETYFTPLSPSEFIVKARKYIVDNIKP